MKTYLRVAFVLLVVCVIALPPGTCFVFGNAARKSVETAKSTGCCHRSVPNSPVRQPVQPLQSAKACCCARDLKPVEKVPPLKLDEVLDGIYVSHEQPGAIKPIGNLLQKPLRDRAGCTLQVLLGVWRC